MIAWIAVASTVAAAAALDRVEGLADDPGTFLVEELPLAAARPGVTSLRWLSQVQPVVRFESGITVGASLSALTLGWETAPDPRGVGVLVAVPTRLGLPTGLVLAGTYRRGALWMDLGMRASSGATWKTRSWTDTQVGPAVGLGWVPGGQRSP